MAVHQRFYTALALHELVQEVPLNDVAQKYAATRGMLQSLQQSAATFAGNVYLDLQKYDPFFFFFFFFL